MDEISLGTADGVCLNPEADRQRAAQESPPPLAGEPRRAEAAPWVGEDRFRALLDAADDAIHVKDLAGRYLFVNNAMLARRGQTREAMLGKTTADFFPPEAARLILAKDRRTIESGQTVDYEEEHLTPAGRIVANTRKVPLRDEDGQVIGIATISRDITERKRAEKALEERKSFLANVFAGIQDGLRVLDTDLTIVSVNPTVERRNAHALPLVGQKCYRAFHGRDEPCVVCPSRRALETGRATSDIVPLVGADGKTIGWLSKHSFPFVDPTTGKIQGVIEHLRDITQKVEAEEALRESEERYRGLFEHMAEGCAVCRMIFEDGRPQDWVYLAVNDAFEPLTGLRGVVGKRASEVIPGIRESDQELFDIYARVSLTGRPEKFEMFVEALQMWFSISVHSPERGLFVAVFDVITERKRAEEELRLAHAELEQRVQKRTAELARSNELLKAEAAERQQAENEIRNLNQKLSRRLAETAAANDELNAFAYTVSHDLRAPLRAMHGFSGIILEEHASQLAPDVQRYLGIIGESARHMGQLIDGLLAFSRLGRQPLRKARVAPGEIARQALAELEAERQGRQVSVSIADLPVCRADPTLLRQVFANLLGNALKFTRKRAVATIEVGWLDQGGERVYFVKDNGAGFDMRYAGKLFGVFQRLHRAQDYQGTGVGLATVQRIVQRHGGRVWVEAAVDQGATFYFTVGGGESIA